MPRAISRLAMIITTWTSRWRHDDRGDLIQNLAWAAVSVVAIIAIGAALQAFGVHVVDWAQKQLGVS